MFTTGAKLYLGLTTAAVAALIVYGVTQNFGALGAVGLIFLVLSLAGLAAVTIQGRDSNISAMDTAAVQSSAAGAQPALDSMWPLVGAVAGVLLVIGVITDRRYFIAGVVVALVATLEWTVRAWSERATGNAVANENIRKRIAHPLELPLAGAFGLAAIVFGFSRIMVAVDKNLGPVLFVAAGALILSFGILFAYRRNISKSVVGVICTVGALILVGSGIAMAGVGERDELTEAYTDKHLARSGEELNCGAELDEHSDHKASGSVAMKSNVLADLTLADGKLELDQISGFEGGGVLTIDRGNDVSVMFHNETEGEYRLRAFAGTTITDANGTEIATDTEYCTQAIGEGEVQVLTFKMPRPSSDDESGTYYLEVPGVDGARVEIVVP